jgi:hypothetical protein
MTQKNGAGRPPQGAFRTTIVSKEGAAIRVEKLELSRAMQRQLTVGVNSIGAPRSREGGGAQPSR